MKRQKSQIKYLDVYYNKGMVFKIFMESLKEQQHAVAKKKLDEQEKARRTE